MTRTPAPGGQATAAIVEIMDRGCIGPTWRVLARTSVQVAQGWSSRGDDRWRAGRGSPAPARRSSLSGLQEPRDLAQPAVVGDGREVDAGRDCGTAVGAEELPGE